MIFWFMNITVIINQVKLVLQEPPCLSYMNKICKLNFEYDKMSYDDVTRYMANTHEVLKSHSGVWVILMHY